MVFVRAKKSISLSNKSKGKLVIRIITKIVDMILIILLKVGRSCGQDAVLAVKYSEPRLQCVVGIPINVLSKICGELGGVPDHPCAKFLSPSIELDAGETEINVMNRKSARALLFPLKVSHKQLRMHMSIFLCL